MHTITSVDDLTPLIGQHLGYSEGHVITQERVIGSLRSSML